MAVATTTRRVRNDPAEVKTSASFRLNPIFRTADFSKMSAPRSSRSGGKSERGAIGIDRRAVATPQPHAVGDAGFGGDRRPVDRHGVETRGAPRLLFAAQPGRLFRRRGEEQRPTRLEIALQFQPANDRREIERGAPPCLPRLTRLARADELLDFDEADARVVGNPPGRCAAGAATEHVRFEERDLDAGRSKGVGGYAAGQPAADDRGVDLSADRDELDRLEHGISGTDRSRASARSALASARILPLSVGHGLFEA